jgi:pSer/pThr/pTyr-binding forkhead associated (FHA) protein
MTNNGMAEHIVLQEVSSGRNYEISLPCVVGRSSQADLTLSDPSISKRHALLVEINNEIWIEDLGSSNGVFVNDLKIQEKMILKPGDSIQLGQTKLVVSQPDEEDLEQTIILHSLAPEADWKLDRGRLKLIYEITTELSGNQDVTVLAEIIFSRFKEIFKQDRCYIALFQEDGTLKPVSLDSFSESIPLSRSIVNRLLKNGESFLLEDALSEAALKEQESVLSLKIRCALCAPLIYHNQIYGLIYLDRNIPGVYKQDDLELLRTIALILAPLIENARLWSELKNNYDGAMETLRQTEARLIDMERTAAYVRLAQAMAHEIRNPLMAIGGLVRRIARSGSESPDSAKMQAIVTLVGRVEMVLKEVDRFVNLPPPEKKLERIDCMIQEVIESHRLELLKKGLRPLVSINTPHVMIPVDSDLFKKALSMIFKELFLSIPQGSEFKIFIQHSGNDLEILMGEVDKNRPFCELFDPELQSKPWSLGLFLNIAHKIISDHGGKVLLDPKAHSPLPILVTMPRTIKV